MKSSLLMAGAIGLCVLSVIMAGMVGYFASRRDKYEAYMRRHGQEPKSTAFLLVGGLGLSAAGFFMAMMMWASSGPNPASISKETTPLIKTTPSQAATESAASAQLQQTLTPQNAHDFASNLSAKMSAYELVLKGAFGRGDQATVEKTLSDLNNIPTWPKGDAMDPYTKCDTAWRDLSILANAQSMLLKNPTDSMRKIEAQEASDYQKSKNLCSARVNMTPEQAEKAEADEYKK